jgi:hypothetical protein
MAGIVYDEELTPDYVTGPVVYGVLPHQWTVSGN